MEPYTALIVGGGRIGVTYEFDAPATKPASHFFALKAHPRINVLGVAESDPQKRDELAKSLPGVTIYPSAEAAFAVVRPDITVVATPKDAHCKVVEEAARARTRLIICEKPIAAAVREAESMVRVCNDRQIPLLVNHMRRFDPVLIRIREEVGAGRLGTVQSATARYVKGLLNNGTHAVDLLRWFLGEVAWVVGWKKEKDDAIGSDDDKDYCADAVVGFENGVRAFLQSFDARGYFLFEHDFFGKEGALLLRELSRSAHFIPVVAGGSPGNYWSLAWEHAWRMPANEGRSFLVGMVEHAIDVLDGRAKPCSTGQDAILTLKTLEAIKASAENGSVLVRLI